MVFEDLVMTFLVLVSAWMERRRTLSAGSLALDIGKAAGLVPR
jgi:hypothetical protein